MTCAELVDSYLIADQDTPQKPGDVFHMGCEYNPQLIATTGYCEGKTGSHGDLMRKGYCASCPDLYGSAVMVYEAIPAENGYEMGDYLTTLEIRDCGYGKSTGEGESQVRTGKTAGTIESGLSLDVYYPTFNECLEWMKTTQGMIFIQIIPAKG
jgi:hypothetical protein